jgi:pyruvate dehydrogenase E1 component alpha subunit
MNETHATTAASPPRPATDDSKRAAERAQLLDLYRQMLMIRRVEEAAAKAYAGGKIGGFLHLGIGQESVCVGAIAALRPSDYVVATYREHGHYMAKAGGSFESAKEVMAELQGKATGASKGLGGSMHLFSAKNRFLGGYGIVGGHVPLACGSAFASKYRGEDDVTLCFFGDGSVPQGAFHEGLHLAGLWKLPVVFICENNQYSMGTPLYRTLAVPDVTERASGYAMARDRFNGDDVLRVRDRVAAAVERARRDHQPTLIEVETYRFRGHSMSDPATYRTKEEVELWKKRDPVPLARERLVGEFGVHEDQVLSLEATVKAEVNEAARFADASPPPPDEYAWKFVYADESIDPRKL